LSGKTGQPHVGDYDDECVPERKCLLLDESRQPLMSTVNRREYFKSLLDGLVKAAGTVIVASTVLPARAVQAAQSSPTGDAATDLLQRADQLASDLPPGVEGEDEEFAKFVNGGFRNAAFRNAAGGGGGFRNGGFANGGGGGFRNGGFANGGGGGGFRNGAWRNISERLTPGTLGWVPCFWLCKSMV
jgi:uncharacterized membrane protein YgcG